MVVMGFPQVLSIYSQADVLTRGKYKAVFKADVVPSPPLGSHRLRSHTDPSATIQVSVHGIS